MDYGIPHIQYIIHTMEVLKMDACERGMGEAYVFRYSGLGNISTYVTDCKKRND